MSDIIIGNRIKPTPCSATIVYGPGMPNGIDVSENALEYWITIERFPRTRMIITKESTEGIELKDLIKSHVEFDIKKFIYRTFLLYIHIGDFINALEYIEANAFREGRLSKGKEIYDFFQKIKED